MTGPGDAIKYPVKLTERVDFEGELAVIIGRLCRGVPRERAEEVIFGYACANDVTARDLQARDGQWTRAKGFDTFCPLGPWMETGTNPADLELVTTVNGEVRQQARTSELLWDVPGLIAYVSQVMTLLPGDVLLTGTPGRGRPADRRGRGVGHDREHRDADQPGRHRRLSSAEGLPQVPELALDVRRGHLVAGERVNRDVLARGDLVVRGEHRGRRADRVHQPHRLAGTAR